MPTIVHNSQETNAGICLALFCFLPNETRIGNWANPLSSDTFEGRQYPRRGVRWESRRTNSTRFSKAFKPEAVRVVELGQKPATQRDRANSVYNYANHNHQGDFFHAFTFDLRPDRRDFWFVGALRPGGHRHAGLSRIPDAAGDVP